MPPWPSFLSRRKSPRTFCLAGAGLTGLGVAGASTGCGVSSWNAWVAPTSPAGRVLGETGRFSMRVLLPATGRFAEEARSDLVLRHVRARAAGADLLQHLRRAVHHEL